MRFDVAPDDDGIVAIRHGFGTQDLTVRCELADGTEVDAALVSIDNNQVEVVTAPGVTVVHLEPAME